MKITYKKHKKTGLNILYIFIILLIIAIGFFVFDKKDPVKEIPNIDKTPIGLREVRDKFVAMLEPNNKNSIFKFVDAIQADPEWVYRCHDIAHDVGHKAYELYGFSDAMTFDNPEHVKHALVQQICAGGYMHGILEQMSISHPGFLERPEMICEAVPESDMASCYHGVGHVMMLAKDYEVPQAILGCRVLKDSTNMYRCFEGVRMEQFWGSTNKNTLNWDTQNPVATCTGLLQDEKPTCFLYSTFGYLRVNPKDYFGAAKMCTKTELASLDTQFCLKGLGMTMMSKFKGQNLEGSEMYIDGFTNEQKKFFYQGVIGYANLSGITDEVLYKSCSLLKNDSLICAEVLSELR